MEHKLLLVGDLHYSKHNPVARTDIYFNAICAKLVEAINIANTNFVSAILLAGDVFNKPSVSNFELIALANILNQAMMPIFVVPGNHDLYGYNLETYNRTSLCILEMAVPNLHKLTYEGITIDSFFLTGSPYTTDMDIEKHCYYPMSKPEALLHVHVVHGMLLPKKPVFARFTLIEDVADTNADVIFAGHDHVGWPMQKHKNTLFINNGALCRLSAHKSEIKRRVGVTLLTSCGIAEFVPLASAFEGSEVLSREHLIEGEEETYLNDFAYNIAEQYSCNNKAPLEIVLDICNESNIDNSIKVEAIKRITEKLEVIK